MTISEAAKRLGLSRNTVALQVRIGVIETTKDERGWNVISEAEVERYRLEHQRRPKQAVLSAHEAQKERDRILRRISRAG